MLNRLFSIMESVTRFPPELRKAYDAWLAQKPFEILNADPHPFVPRLCETPGAREAAEATSKTAESQRQAGAAGSVSGQYLANTLLFAAVLFFANAAGRFNVKVHQLVIASFARSKGLHNMTV
jgi:hypothetical protein